MDSNEAKLTHDDIWDDSALVRSWDDALAEYKVGWPTQMNLTKLIVFRNITVSTPAREPATTWDRRPLKATRGEPKLFKSGHVSL